MQCFLSFGTQGIWGTVLAGVVISVAGLVILQLGSCYQAEDHSNVFRSLTHRAVPVFLDVCVTVTVFALGFVMMAGAGSTMAQQFGWPVWGGSALALVLLTGLLDVEKVTHVISYLTPLGLVAIVGAFVYSLTQLPVDIGNLDQLARQELSPITPWWLSAVNYAGLVLITAVSMALVIGGNYLDPKEAGRGWLAGGLPLTTLLLILSLGLLLSFDSAAGVPVPTLELFNGISPALGTVMVWIIYLMIYSTCIGPYYSLGRRLSAGRPKWFYPFFATAAVAGFFVSFIGFEDLIASVYPALGYLGLILAVVLALGYLRERPNIGAESERRIQIRALFTKLVHPAPSPTPPAR